MVYQIDGSSEIVSTVSTLTAYAWPACVSVEFRSFCQADSAVLAPIAVSVKLAPNHRCGCMLVYSSGPPIGSTILPLFNAIFSFLAIHRIGFHYPNAYFLQTHRTQRHRNGASLGKVKLFSFKIVLAITSIVSVLCHAICCPHRCGFVVDSCAHIFYTRFRCNLITMFTVVLCNALSTLSLFWDLQ